MLSQSPPIRTAVGIPAPVRRWRLSAFPNIRSMTTVSLCGTFIGFLRRTTAVFSPFGGRLGPFRPSSAANFEPRWRGGSLRHELCAACLEGMQAWEDRAVS